MTRRDFSLLALGSIPFPERLPAVGLDQGGALLAYLHEYARLLDERRRKRFELISTPESVDALRQEVRQKLRDMWGPLPTADEPLNPRVAGTLEDHDLAVEKILFDSRPGFLVPANLYRPLHPSSQPLPAVVVVCGHDPLGKASELIQRVCTLLAHHGMIALAYDPVGCGERPQFSSGSPAERQRALAIHCSAVGLNLMNYRAWDCRRAVDYLEQRPDVDPQKIAIAGDGAEALEYAAFDERIAAAFPTGQVVSFKAFIDAAVINDPERVLYGSLREGLEHAELLASMAPHPLVVGAPQRGLLSVEATARTFNEAMRAYRAAGSADVASLIDANEASALGPDIRRAGVDWLSRWLSPVSRTVVEEFGRLFSAEELRCGPAEGLQTKTVIDLNRERAALIAPTHEVPAESSRFEVYKHGIRQRIKDVSRVGSFLPERGIEITDRTIDAGRYAQGVAVVLSDRGREDPWLRRAVIDPIVAAQYSVVALDLRGWGSGAPLEAEGFDWENFFADSSLQIGRPLLGQRMKDLLAVPAARIGRRSWTVVGVGDAALVAAHAAAIDDRVDKLITVNGLLSFHEALNDPLTKHPMSSFPPGIIGEYDVRDVYAAVGPRPVLALNPVDAQRQAVQEVQAWERFDWISQAYENIGAPNGFQMHARLDSSGLRKAISAWLQS
jgi:pimeloyl-ACP methyl ester carboxylesterase